MHAPARQSDLRCQSRLVSHGYAPMILKSAPLLSSRALSSRDASGERTRCRGRSRYCLETIIDTDLRIGLSIQSNAHSQHHPPSRLISVTFRARLLTLNRPASDCASDTCTSNFGKLPNNPHSILDLAVVLRKLLFFCQDDKEPRKEVSLE